MNHFNLNLDINPIIEKENLLDIFKSAYQIRLPSSLINPKLVNFLLSKKIKIKHSETFYSTPFFVQPIHTDVLGGDIAKLNFVFGGKDSIMNWYKIKPNINVPNKVTGAGTLYSEYTLDQVDLIETAEIKMPCLVQVGVPHNIINDSEIRICVSLILGNLDNEILTMSESTELLKDYMVPLVGLEPTRFSF